MQINKLKLNNFKNYEEEQFEFNPKINIFTGKNGAGKTNILDAIYYLSFTKSYFNPIDSQNIRYDQDYFYLQGQYINSSESIDEVSCGVKLQEKKRFKLNNKEYGKISDHIGLIPLVIICPLDSQLIYNASEYRRKYIDSVISQFDRNYLDILIRYNKTLQQRNAYLKYLNENRGADLSNLDLWDNKIAILGDQIYHKRKVFLDDFIPVINEYYDFISGEKESVGIAYSSHLQEGSYLDLLKENRSKDLILRHTSVGTHRDDLIFNLNEHPLKKFGSQGQQKSFLVALKLAQFEYTKKLKGFKPLLLLDDIFDKLDINRIEQLMKLVSRNEFGQIFITDTNKERIEGIFNNIDVDLQITEIKNGEKIK